MTFFERFTKGVEGTPRSDFYHRLVGKKVRLIGEPNEAMQEVQARLRTFLRAIAPVFYSSASSKYGLGAIRNARKHIGSDFAFKLDFSDAFESTDGRRLARFIAERVRKYYGRFVAPNKDEWYEFLLKYALTRRGGLIQGSLVSPLLLDWYCEETVDLPIRRFLTRLKRIDGKKIVYTRFVDDLTFSGPAHSFSCLSPLTRRFRREIRWIIFKAGYRENPQKTEVANLSVNGTVRITGVRVGTNGHIGLSRKEVKAMERILDTALRFPLFADKPAVIEVKLRRLLDVIRGKNHLNALEGRTIEMYVRWCEENGRDSSWSRKLLERKKIVRGPRKTPKKKKVDLKKEREKMERMLDRL